MTPQTLTPRCERLPPGSNGSQGSLTPKYQCSESHPCLGMVDRLNENGLIHSCLCMIDLLNKNSLIQKCTKQHNMAVGGFSKSKIHVDSHSDWAFFYKIVWCTCHVSDVGSCLVSYSLSQTLKHWRFRTSTSWSYSSALMHSTWCSLALRFLQHMIAYSMCVEKEGLEIWTTWHKRMELSWTHMFCHD